MSGNVSNNKAVDLINKYLKDWGLTSQTVKSSDVTSIFQSAERNEDGTVSRSSFEQAAAAYYEQDIAALEDEYLDAWEAFAGSDGNSDSLSYSDISNANSEIGRTYVDSENNYANNDAYSAPASGGNGSSASSPSVPAVTADSLSGKSVDELQSGRGDVLSDLDSMRSAKGNIENLSSVQQAKSDVESAKELYDTALEDLENDEIKNENDKTLDDLKTDKEAKEQEISDQQSVIDGINDSINSQNSLIDSINSDISSLEEPNEADYKTTNSEGEEVTDTAAYNAAKEEYEAKKAELEQQLADAETKLAELEQSLQEAETAMTVLEEEAAQIDNDIQEITQKILEDDSENEQAQAVQESLTKYQEAQAALDEIEQAELSQIESNITQLQDNLSAYEEAITAAEEAENTDEADGTDGTESTDDTDGTDGTDGTESTDDSDGTNAAGGKNATSDAAEDTDAARDEETGVLEDLPESYSQDARIKVDADGNYYVEAENYSNDTSVNGCLYNIIKNSYDFEALGVSYDDAKGDLLNAIVEQNNISDPNLITTGQKIDLPNAYEVLGIEDPAAAEETPEEAVERYQQELEDNAENSEEFTTTIQNALNDENISIDDKLSLLESAKNLNSDETTNMLKEDDSFFVNSFKEMASSDEYSVDDILEMQDRYLEIQGDDDIDDANYNENYLEGVVLLCEKAFESDEMAKVVSAYENYGASLDKFVEDIQNSTVLDDDKKSDLAARLNTVITESDLINVQSSSDEGEDHEVSLASLVEELEDGPAREYVQELLDNASDIEFYSSKDNMYSQLADAEAKTTEIFTNALNDENVSVQDKMKIMQAVANQNAEFMETYLSPRDNPSSVETMIGIMDQCSSFEDAVSVADTFENLYQDSENVGISEFMQANLSVNSDRAVAYTNALIGLYENASPEEIKILNEKYDTANTIQQLLSKDKETAALTGLLQNIGSNLPDDAASYNISEEDLRYIEDYESTYLSSSDKTNVQNILKDVKSQKLDSNVGLYLLNKACDGDMSKLAESFRDMSSKNEERYLDTMLGMFAGINVNASSSVSDDTDVNASGEQEEPQEAEGEALSSLNTLLEQLPEDSTARDYVQAFIDNIEDKNFYESKDMYSQLADAEAETTQILTEALQDNSVSVQDKVKLLQSLSSNDQNWIQTYLSPREYPFDSLSIISDVVSQCTSVEDAEALSAVFDDLYPDIEGYSLNDFMSFNLAENSEAAINYVNAIVDLYANASPAEMDTLNEIFDTSNTIQQLLSKDNETNALSKLFSSIWSELPADANEYNLSEEDLNHIEDYKSVYLGSSDKSNIKDILSDIQSNKLDKNTGLYLLRTLCDGDMNSLASIFREMSSGNQEKYLPTLVALFDLDLS